MKKVFSLIFVLTLLCSFFLVGAMSPINVEAANETTAVNTDQFSSEAVTIEYAGGTSKRYGIQAYAGVSGPVWVTGDVVTYTDEGTDSHKMGSNASDGRSGLTFTFKVNSSVSGNFALGIHGLFNETSGCTVTVNDGDAVEYNLMNSRGSVWNESVGGFVNVTLIEGLNTIVLKMQDNYTCWVSSFYLTDNIADDSYYQDREVYSREAEVIEFVGESTAKYGIQSSAGISGPAWVVGVTIPVADASVAHMLGSNTGDGRSALKLTFKVNSQYSMDAVLNLYTECYGVDGTNATLDVNGVQSNINIYELSGVTEGTVYSNTAIKVPVTLVEGLNTITITLQDSYGIWVGAYSVDPVGAIPKLPTYEEVTVATYDSKEGSMHADQYAFGLNAYDNPADYGKTGSITYKFTVEEAGNYYLRIAAMAGANLANRIKITVNGEVQIYNEKEYLALSTAAGWSGDSLNTVVVPLIEGENEVKFENSLACVDTSRQNEVEPGTEGAVLVSNWWVHAVSFERIPNTELLVDATNAQTLFNLNRKFNAEGLVVSLKVDDEVTVLDSSQYTIDSSAFSSAGYGTCEIIVKLNDSDLSAKYLVNVGDAGVPFEGKVFDFNGDYTGANLNSFYNYAKIEGEGTGVCEGRLFWTAAHVVYGDGGYGFGSAGVGEWENRQVTLTLTINSSVAGRYLFKAAIETTNRNYANMSIKINDEAEYDACLFYSSGNLPYIFEVNLVEGLNTIKLTSMEQYSYWYHWFELAPIEYKSVNTELNANQGVRYGYDIIDCEASDIWGPTTGERALSYYYDLEAGKYLINLSTTATGEKDAVVYVDGVAYNVKVVNGVTSVPVEVEAGKHVIKVYASGNNSDFALSKINVVKDIKPVSLNIDTTNSTLTIPYDGILDTTTITAQLVYDDESVKDLANSEFKIVAPEGYSTTVAGTYEFKVVYKANEEIYTTFTVVVEEPELVSIEVKTNPTKLTYQVGEQLDLTGLVIEAVMSSGTKETISITNDMVSGFDSSKTGTNTITITYEGKTVTIDLTIVQATPEPTPNIIGCGGSIVASILGLLVLTAAVLVISKRKKMIN